MKHLQRREKNQDVTFWLNSFLRAMGLLVSDVNNNPDLAKMNPLVVDDFDQYLSDFMHLDVASCNGPGKLTLILDYDGTLAAISKKPEFALLEPETRDSLKRLSKYEDQVSIVIISGRSLSNIKNMVHLDGITYAGSHGLEILLPDGSKYIRPITVEHEQKISALCADLEKVCEGTEGAWIENKGALLTCHYREVKNNLRADLVARATAVFDQHGFHAYQAPMALEAKPSESEWDRGRASLHILRTLFGEDWSDITRVIYAGDDQSDEEAMEALSGIATTFKVASTTTSTRTCANYRLKSPNEVLLMLQWIEKRLLLSRSPSPAGSPRTSKSPPMHSCSFDESSDDDMRRIRTNSRGRTQNIFRTTKRRNTLLDSAVRKLSESNSSLPRSSPEPFPLPPSPRLEIKLNRVL